MEMMTLHAQNDFDISAAMLHASFQDIEEVRLGALLKEQLARGTADLKNIVAAFDEREAISRRDRRPEAHARWLADTQAQALESIERCTRPLLNKLLERNESLRARMVAPPADQKELAALVIEARSRLRLFDPLIVQQIYLECCRTRDAVCIAAVESAPRWDALVDDECLAAGRRIQMALDHPDVVSAIQETEKILAALESAVRTCKRHCGLNGDIEVTTVADAV